MLNCSNGTVHKKSLCLERREVTDMNNSKSMSKNVCNSQRSVAIDFLRVIAIVAVVCVHNLPVPIISGGGGGFWSLPQLVRFLKSVCRYS